MRYRFLGPVGDVVFEQECPRLADALALACSAEHEAEVQRVEHLGPVGDWRWAGPLQG